MAKKKTTKKTEVETPIVEEKLQVMQKPVEKSKPKVELSTSLEEGCR